MRNHLALAALLLALGGAGGYLLAPRASHEPGSSGTAAGQARLDAASRGLTEADVQRVIRQELAAARSEARASEASGAAEAASDAETAAAAAEEAAPPLAPAAAEALQAAQERIERARAARQWTQADATALTAAFEVLPPAHRDELLHTLVPALNRGEIQLAYRGPLFQ
jgi:hypothetical protein